MSLGELVERVAECSLGTSRIVFSVAGGCCDALLDPAARTFPPLRPVVFSADQWGRLVVFLGCLWLLVVVGLVGLRLLDLPVGLLLVAELAVGLLHCSAVQVAGRPVEEVALRLLVGLLLGRLVVSLL